MSAPRVASHYDARGERLLGAVFMTYTLGIRAFEDRVLPALLSLRSAPDDPELDFKITRSDGTTVLPASAAARVAVLRVR